MKRTIQKALSLVLSLVLLLGLAVPTAAAAYSDTQGHWAEGAIQRWSQYGILQGYGDGFHPNDPITRGQMATVLAKTLGLTETGANPFTDVPADAWYAQAVLQCYAAGVMQGDGRKADPNANITREQAMVMLGRALAIAPAASPDLSGYGDGSRVSPWAAPYVAAMVEAGIVSGIGGGLLGPADTMTRAALVTVLDRAVVQYIPTSGTHTLAQGEGIVLVAAGDVTLTGKTAANILVTPAADGKTLSFDKAQVTGSITVQADDAVISTKNSTLPEIAQTGGGNSGNGERKTWEDSVLYLTGDGEWKLLQGLDGKAESRQLLNSTHTSKDDFTADFSLPIYTPVSLGGVYFDRNRFDDELIREAGFGSPHLVWFGDDGENLYFLSGISGEYFSNSTLYTTNVKTMDTDVVAKNIATHSVIPFAGGVAYLAQREAGYELYVSNDDGVERLAENVYDFCVFEDAHIYFTQKAGDTYNILYVPADGSESPATVASGVSNYYYEENAATLFYCVANGKNSNTSTVWRVKEEDKPEKMFEDCLGQQLDSVDGDTFFYTSLRKDASDADKAVVRYVFFDGKKTETLMEETILQHTVLDWPSFSSVPGSCFDHEQRSISYFIARVQEEGSLISYVVHMRGIGKVNVVDIPWDAEHLRQAYCCGTLTDGNEIILWSSDDSSILSVPTGRGDIVSTVAENCWPPLYNSARDSIYCFLSPSAEVDETSVVTVAEYRRGAFKELAENVNLLAAQFYDDGTMLFLAGGSMPGTLKQYADGKTTVIAENVSYYLRRTDESILYISDGTLYLYDGKTQTRLAGDVARLYCGSAEYGQTILQIAVNGYQW